MKIVGGRCEAVLSHEDLFANSVMRHILAYLNRPEMSKEAIDAIVREIINLMPQYQSDSRESDKACLIDNSFFITKRCRKVYRSKYGSAGLNQNEMKEFIKEIVEIIEDEAEDLL